MCQQCTQKAVELEGKIASLKEETLKLASQAGVAYTDVGAMGGAIAIALSRVNEIPSGEIELLVQTAKLVAHILKEADQYMTDLFGKSMELGVLRSVQDALYMAESAGQMLGEDFGMVSHGQPKKKPTVH